MNQSNTLTHGFKLVNHYPIHEIGSECFIYEHEQTGANLMYLKNEDSNKVFSATFKTPPTDHTGVPHIVEHCVLSGSRKYHTKEPFMDMIKGSMNTFINAMTFSDKTMYPVASKNEKDFYNLMDVYLDAVFFPMIYDTESIFMQEGWRFDIQNPEEPITYKGIVYNEMKGAYSDPMRELEFLMDQTLLHGTTYANESGGHPNHITELSYEDFLAFHKKHYHPSNAYLFLYGDLNIDEALEHMHSDYLSHFTKEDMSLEIDTLKVQTDTTLRKGIYPVTDDESTENKDYLGLAYVIGKATDPMICFTASLLNAALINSSASPLRQALLDADIAQDIMGTSGDGLYKRFQIMLKHTSTEHAETFKKIVLDTLTDICEKGLDKDLLLSTINKFEYDLKEAEGFHTKGIIYHISSMESWLYSDKPSALLEYGIALKSLREGVENGYFENFIKENILNQNPTLVAIEPQKGVLKAKEEEDVNTLKAYKSSLSNEAIDHLVSKNKALNEKQLNPDSKEALATIPKLSRNDVSREGEFDTVNVLNNAPYTLLHAPVFTSGIIYLDAFFDLSHLTEEEISYAALIASLLSDVSTENRNYGELSNHIYKVTGGFRFNVQLFKHYHDRTKDALKFVCRTKTIAESLTPTFELTEELLLRSRFDDEKRLKELIGALFAMLQSDLVDSGNSYVSGRVASHLSASDAKIERASGIAFYQFINGLVETFDTHSKDLMDNLHRVYAKMTTKSNFAFTFAGDVMHQKTIEEKTAHLFEVLLDAPEIKGVDTPLNPISEGFKTSSNVQFVCKGFDFKAAGHENTGSLHVLTALLNSDYLHNRVRAKGGAYGCGAKFDYAGIFTIASYRDPNLDETYKVYEGISDFIKTLDITDEEVEKYIIGAMSRIDAARTPSQTSYLASTQYIIGKTKEDAQRVRESLLDTTREDLLKLADFMKDFSSRGIKCTLGNSDRVAENASHFEKIQILSC